MKYVKSKYKNNIAQVVDKDNASTRRLVTFKLSDEQVDRDGDIILIDAWNLENFKKNPVLLAHHNKQDFPVGRFTKLWKENKELYGEVKFAKRGTSPVADMAYELIKQDILKSVSVGFSGYGEPMEDENGGIKWTDVELLEVSLVSVPANPRALAIAKVFTDEPETREILIENKDNEEKQINEDVESEVRGILEEKQERLDVMKDILGTDMNQDSIDEFLGMVEVDTNSNNTIINLLGVEGEESDDVSEDDEESEQDEANAELDEEKDLSPETKERLKNLIDLLTK